MSRKIKSAFKKCLVLLIFWLISFIEKILRSLTHFLEIFLSRARASHVISHILPYPLA